MQSSVVRDWRKWSRAEDEFISCRRTSKHGARFRAQLACCTVLSSDYEFSIVVKDNWGQFGIHIQNSTVQQSHSFDEITFAVATNAVMF